MWNATTPRWRGSDYLDPRSAAGSGVDARHRFGSLQSHLANGAPDRSGIFSADTNALLSGALSNAVSTPGSVRPVFYYFARRVDIGRMAGLQRERRAHVSCFVNCDCYQLDHRRRTLRTIVYGPIGHGL